jgi:uncharacterized protein
MILYLDTSALVKKYFKEPGSDLVIIHWNRAEEIATSSVAYAEALASIYRKKREVQTEEPLIQAALNSLNEDWPGFIRVEVNDGLNGNIEKVLQKHQLRGFDAIHLASALLIKERLPEDFIFACFDQRLMSAAVVEGLNVLPSSIQTGGINRK